MKFEYNGNLLEDERISLVAKEILDTYPQISIKKAEEAAMLEGRISSKITPCDVFNRLYNIMLVNSDNKNIVLLVYKDFLHLLKENRTEETNYFVSIADGINSFLQNYTQFPLLSDYQ